MPKPLTAEALYLALKNVQEKKGYYFNPNLAGMTFPILEQLLVNKQRYGYLLCPCRLTSGSKELDEDLLCPCDYREPDVAEFGSCYCGLYLSKEEAENHQEEIVVPERRPIEKRFPGLTKRR